MTTMLETLNETANAYTSKTRAVDSFSSCRYFTQGRCCAVGRCLEDPERFAIQSGTVVTFNTRHRLEEVLKPEYRGYPLAFWRDLQWLHDNEAHWDENGLSDSGKKEVAAIKRKFNL